MSSINQVTIMGRLGFDPEVRYSASGKAVCALNIATSERFKSEDGERQERTDWHRVVLFGKTAEVAGEYLKKGNLAHFTGKLRTNKWTDKEGVDRYSTSILVSQMQMLSPKPKSETTAQTEEAGQSAKPAKKAGGRRVSKAEKIEENNDAFPDTLPNDIPF